MSDDYLLLLFFYIVYGLTLTAILLISKTRKKTAIINLTILIAYSSLFFWNLIYNSSFGSSLLWFFYLIFAIGLHWIINLIGLITNIIKNKRLTKKQKTTP